MEAIVEKFIAVKGLLLIVMLLLSMAVYFKYRQQDDDDDEYSELKENLTALYTSLKLVMAEYGWVFVFLFIIGLALLIREIQWQQRIQACVDFHTMYDRAQCINYLITMGN